MSLQAIRSCWQCSTPADEQVSSSSAMNLHSKAFLTSEQMLDGYLTVVVPCSHFGEHLQAAVFSGGGSAAVLAPILPCVLS